MESLDHGVRFQDTPDKQARQNRSHFVVDFKTCPDNSVGLVFVNDLSHDLSLFVLFVLFVVLIDRATRGCKH